MRWPWDHLIYIMEIPLPQKMVFTLKHSPCLLQVLLTHWGRVTHICVGKVTIIGSDNGLSPDWRQAIIWTNAGLLSIEPLRTYFSENWIKIQPFSLKKMHMKMASAKWRPSCLGLNVINWPQELCKNICGQVDELEPKPGDLFWYKNSLTSQENFLCERRTT